MDNKHFCDPSPTYVCHATSPSMQQGCVGYQNSDNPTHRYCKWNYTFYSREGQVSDYCHNPNIKLLADSEQRK